MIWSYLKVNVPQAVCVFLLVFISHAAIAAQKKDKVEVASKVTVESADKNCANLKPGRILSFPKPVYPAEARAGRVGGTVSLSVEIDEKGTISDVKTISGHQLLVNSAAEAARKAKFSSPTCDGKPALSSAVLTYNFLPFISAENYFTPAKIEELTDLKIDSPYYEAVLNLTENYKFAFGYADKKFYADAPLARGDFAQYLRLTLDLLSDRAQTANKLPREINLFRPHNPQKLLSVNSVRDIKPGMPFYESVKTLLLKYDIALTNEKGEFQGRLHLTNNEVIDWWSKIFGEEAIPINFGRISDGDRIISRGEFALFLQESLQVLTYKVLP